MEANKDKSWNPYITGILSGILIVISVLISGKFFGASTTFVRSTGMIEKIFNAERVTRLDYFIKEVPEIDWQWMFVLGILIGSFISAITSGSFHWKGIPDMWKKRFGSSRVKRAIVAFIGGLIAMFGARLAGG